MFQKVTWRAILELLLLFQGLALFVLDVGSDCNVAHQYRLQGEKAWFDMTLTFIIIPFFIVNFTALYQTVKRSSEFPIVGSCLAASVSCCPDPENDNICCALIVLCIQLILFSTSMLDRYRQELLLWKRKYIDCSPCCENYQECNCENCKKLCEVVSESKKSAYRLAWIRYIETLLESIPQWCLQVYVMLNRWSFPGYAVFSTAVALWSLALSNTALERARSKFYGYNFNLKSTFLYFTSQLAVMVARLISIVTCAYALKNLIFFLLLFFWAVVSFLFISFVCGYMIVTYCRGDYEPGSAKKTCKNLMLVLPLTFYVSETVLESFGFKALWMKMFLFVAKSFENLCMLVIASRYSLPHLDTWMPIAWSLFVIGTFFGFVSLITRHFQKRREVPASPDANDDEPQVKCRHPQHQPATTSATNRGAVA